MATDYESRLAIVGNSSSSNGRGPSHQGGPSSEQNANYYAARAVGYLVAKNYQSAVTDAQFALQLDAGNTQVYLRVDCVFRFLNDCYRLVWCIGSS